MKNHITAVLAAGLALFCAASCVNRQERGAITVISREDGSGTRAAFTSLFDIQESGAAGTPIDATVDTADITNSTAVVITSTAQNKNAIGYISLGSLTGTVKVLEIDGVAANEAAVKDGSYTISRSLNIVVKRPVPPLAEDFISFMLSADGQELVEKTGYIMIDQSGSYQQKDIAGKIVIAGSSSVTPVMEKLKEAYLVINPSAHIELQQSDSSMGINNTIEGVCDIGMSSRELKANELSKGIEAITIAYDGIAVIVHPENPVAGLSKEEVRDIYMGKITSWQALK